MLTAKISGWLKASPLERRVRPEGQKGAPGLEDVRSPGKTAGPRKRRSAARLIAGGACCTSAGVNGGLHDAEYEGTNAQGKPPAVGGSA